MNKKIISPKILLPYYFSWKINNNNTNYNVCFSYKLPKNTNIHKLKKSITILVENRPHLRSNFKFKNNKIMYVIHKNLSPIINEISVHNENECSQQIEKKIKEPHDLNNESLLKITFLNRSYKNDSIILFNIHHSIIDGSSLDNFILDISKVYNGLQIQKESDESHLNSLLIQSKIESNINDPQLKNYINLLKEISCDSERYSFNDSMKITSSYNIMNNDLYELILNFSEKNKISIFNILLLSWCIFEAKLFNKKKLIVTYPVNIRNDKNENGCFINTINYPFIYENNQNILSLIEHLKIQMPTLKKLHYINIIDFIDSNDQTYSHLAYSEYAKLKNLEIKDQTITAVPYPQMANSVFGIKYIKENNKIYLLSESYSGIIPEYISSDLVNRFLNFLEKLIRNPELKFSNLNILYKDEYNHNIYDLNKTEAEYTNNKSLSQIFEYVVKKNQNKIVAIDKRKTLSYLELNNKSNQLARCLLEKKVNRKDIIAILIDNRIEMLIAILAVLKIGATYLPISHDTPKERIKFILNDSNSKKLLSIPKLYQNEFSHIEFIDLSNNKNYLNDFSNIDIELSEKDVAYLIYTSGSTGHPKGVLVENKTVINLIEFHIKRFQISPQDNLSKFSSFSFDASIVEIFSSLLSGATLYFIPEDFRIDTNKLNDFFNKNNITFSFLPTQFAELFIRLKNYSLKTLIVGGEKLKYLEKTSYQLVNAYGPTEATVCTTIFNVNRYYENIPIGKPIQNSKIYILNNDYNPCPYFMEGEIFIGGENLAQKYLNQKDLTDKKFIPNPFQTQEEKKLGLNGRIYKSGDLGRLLPDGNIEILGRTDFQLKILGYRIEINEIERQILTIPGIKNTVVIGFNDKSGQKYLCAYYMSDNRLNVNFLKEFLQKNLPIYMIPKIFIYIKNLPLNSNGKIDKKSLPKPDFKELQTNIYSPPSNEKEKIISNLFSEILEIENISVHSDFFILGGNSIKVIKLIDKLQVHFKVDISQIFIHRSIKKLAEKLEFKSIIYNS